jgi:hypothetical protein
LGGKGLLVISALTVLEVHPWDVRDGRNGYGSKERSKGKVEFHVKCRVWGDTSGGGENWGESMCNTITNSIVNSNFADECAFEDVCANSLSR